MTFMVIKYIIFKIRKKLLRRKEYVYINNAWAKGRE